MKYRKKPVVIDATQFWPWSQPWPEGVEQRSLGGSPDTIDGEQVQWFVKTLEGEHIATPGDWIITGVKGERYPCKPDIFSAAYEPAE